MLSPVFAPFIKNSPISIMARGMLERVLNPDQLNEWFDTTAKEQYTKDLLFSTLFDLMSQVVQGSPAIIPRPPLGGVHGRTRAFQPRQCVRDLGLGDQQ